MTDLKRLIEKAIVLDVETSINKKPYDPAKYSPSPWFNNYIVAFGVRHQLFDPILDAGVQIYYDASPPSEYHGASAGRTLDKLLKSNLQTWGNHSKAWNLLVGHNIKFDLGHIIYSAYSCGESTENIQKYLGNIWVWDTMIAEYYLSNQHKTSISLEDLAAHHHVKFSKDLTVAESFKAGLGADHIDKAHLIQYLKSDLQVTEAIFKSQLAEALSKGGPAYVQYLLHLMGATLATLQAETNGMQLNCVGMAKEEGLLVRELDIIEDRLIKAMALGFGCHAASPPSPSSPLALSVYLYGGDYAINYTKPVLDKNGEEVLYKSGAKKGQVRTKKMTSTESFSGIIPKDILQDSAVKYAVASSGPGKGKTTDSNALTTILQHGIKLGHVSTLPYHEFISDVLKHRQIKKDVTTYYQGMMKHRTFNGCIHPSYNHAIARTKRLTSSSPNMQNVSNKGEVR